MIGRLRGELVSLDGSLALVEAAGVGYEVSIPDLVALQLPPIGSEVTFLIRQIFREDGVSLCGFVDSFQRRLFDLLLSVKGCGPKVALALLGQVGEEAASIAIVEQDARTLTRATGVGTRLAERIVLELKDKLQEERLLRKAERASATSQRVKPSDDLVDTLLTLGYRRHEAESAAAAAQDVPGELADRLKHALGLLKK